MTYPKRKGLGCRCRAWAWCLLLGAGAFGCWGMPAVAQTKEPGPEVTPHSGFRTLLLSVPADLFDSASAALKLRMPEVSLLPWPGPAVDLRSPFAIVDMQDNALTLLTNDGRMFRRELGGAEASSPEEFARSLASFLLAVQRQEIAPQTEQSAFREGHDDLGAWAQTPEANETPALDSPDASDWWLSVAASGNVLVQPPPPVFARGFGGLGGRLEGRVEHRRGFTLGAGVGVLGRAVDGLSLVRSQLGLVVGYHSVRSKPLRVHVGLALQVEWARLRHRDPDYAWSTPGARAGLAKGPRRLGLGAFACLDLSYRFPKAHPGAPTVAVGPSLRLGASAFVEDGLKTIGIRLADDPSVRRPEVVRLGGLELSAGVQVELNWALDTKK